MPRTARIVDPAGGYSHVICRGNNKAVIFHDACDYRAFLRVVVESQNLMPFEVPFFALMPNHYHLLIKMPENLGEGLGLVMKRINQDYSLHYRKRYGFVGRIWQGRFKSFIIDTDAYMQTCGIYIEANPVRAGIARKADEYAWSSAPNGERGLSPKMKTTPGGGVIRRARGGTRR